MTALALKVMAAVWGLLFAAGVLYGVWLVIVGIYETVLDKGYRAGWRDGLDDAHEVIDEVSKQKEQK